MESLRDSQSRSALFVVLGVLIGAGLTRTAMHMTMKHLKPKEETKNESIQSKMVD
ncbi:MULTISPECIES: hypothetical protein [Bacillus cereus group]|uniref:hypothetical protein n=1 Tax=Bacillus cereus group TaxID=86661 RepID=UPI0021CFC2F6|nr:hypothetical protein [Bacillus paranthracis]MCU5568095.1 hypothetical protein [Bacillus paranthracis]